MIHGSLKVTFFVLVLGASCACTMSDVPSPGPASKPYRSLAEAVRAGVVDPAVVIALRRGGAADGLLIIEERGAADLARGTSRAFTPEEWSDALLNEVRPSVLRAIFEPRKTSIQQSVPAIEILRRYPFLPLMFVRFPDQRTLLATLNHADVVAVTADATVPLLMTESLPLVNQPPSAGWGETGANVTIASLDSGLDYLRNPSTTALFGGCTVAGSPGCRVLEQHEFAGPDNALDDIRHGSVVGAIAASVATGARFVSLDVVNAGSVVTSAAVAAIDWTVQNRTRLNIRVANMSFGDGHSSSSCDAWHNAFTRPVSLLRLAGVAPVAGSGNSATPGGGAFRDGIASPACLESAIPVGAVYDAAIGAFSAPVDPCTDATTAPRQIACWSQSGANLRLLAPGHDIATPSGSMVGTSMSVPFVSGALAILASSHPSLSVTALKTALENSGPIASDTRNATTQRVLDIAAAQCSVASVSNDAFDSAQALSGFGSLTFRNWCATREAMEPDHGAPGGVGSVWFRWTVPFTGEVRLTTAGSDHDTLIAVYRGSSLTTLTPVATNDDRSPLTTSEVRFAISSGEQLMIAVDAKRNASGTGQGTVVLRWSPVDFNDALASATQLNAQMFHEVEGVNVGATKEPNEANHCSDPGGASVWYTWTSFARARAMAQVIRGPRKCVAVYTRNSGSGLVAAGTYPGDVDDTVWFDTLPNTTYYIAVDGLVSEGPFPTPSQSDFTLRVGLRKQITFASLRDGNYEIYAMEPDGTSSRRLTNSPATDREPASDASDWQIAFTSDRDGNNEIYVMNGDGSDVRRITNHPANDRSPTFTTDGGAIVFVSDRDGNNNLYMVGLGGLFGNTIERLTTTASDDLDPATVTLPNRLVNTAHSRFAVFDPVTGAGDYDLRIRFASDPGSEISAGTSAEDRQPSWSSDGQTLVFTAVDTSGFETLWIWDRQSRARSLGSAQASDGTWSPWGDEIVFATTRTGNGEIFRMRRDGRGPENLTNHTAWDGDPHWK